VLKSILFISLITLALTVAFVLETIHAQNIGVGALNWGDSLVQAITASFGNRWGNPRAIYYPLSYSICAFSAFISIYLLIKRAFNLAAVLLILIVAGIAEFVMISQAREALAWGLHCFAIVLGSAFFAYVYRSKNSGVTFQDKDLLGPKQLYGAELISALIVFSVALGFRFYNLNLHPHGWDTELCDYRYAGLRSFQSLLSIEAATPRPTSNGFAWTFIFWLLGNLDDPDNYYLLIRLVGTVIGVVKLAALYLCIRYLAGPIPALFGFVVMTFGPPENWWSRQPSHHHLPGLVAILIVFTTAHAYLKRSWTSFLLASLTSVLARTMYASGLFLAFIPISFFCSLLIFNWSEWRRFIPKISLLLVGVLIWFFWSSIAGSIYQQRLVYIPPLSVPAAESSSGGVNGFLTKVFLHNLPDLFTTVFHHQVNPTHWTIPFTLAPARSVTSLTIVFGVLGLARLLACRGGAIGFLLLVSIFWAAVPGLATSVADRRVGAIFAVLIIFAARELGYVLKVFYNAGLGRLGVFCSAAMIAVMLPYLAWVGVALDFSQPAGLPAQVVYGRMLRTQLERDTLTLLLSADMYCDAYMAVARDLDRANCSMGWAQMINSPNGVQLLIEEPKIDLYWFKERNPRLSQCFAERNTKWGKMNFIFNNRSDWQGIKRKLESRYPQGVFSVLNDASSNMYGLQLFSYRVEGSM
jgi:hypothetical protein